MVLVGRSLLSWLAIQSKLAWKSWENFFILTNLSAILSLYRVYYVVQHIAKERFNHTERCVEYELMWDGGEKSWVTMADMEDAPEVIAEWLIRRKATDQPEEYGL